MLIISYHLQRFFFQFYYKLRYSVFSFRFLLLNKNCLGVFRHEQKKSLVIVRSLVKDYLKKRFEIKISKLIKNILIPVINVLIHLKLLDLVNCVFQN